MPWISKERLAALEAAPAKAVEARDEEVVKAFRTLWPKHASALQHAAGIPTYASPAPWGYFFDDFAHQGRRMVDTLIRLADDERGRRSEAREAEIAERRRQEPSRAVRDLLAGKTPEPKYPGGWYA